MAAAPEPTIDTAAVWIDSDSDQAHARLGSTSRYADMVLASTALFADAWTSKTPAAIAAHVAWLIAIDAGADRPGYARQHSRIFELFVDWTDDGALTVKLELITPQSEALAAFVAAAADGEWSDWPVRATHDDPHRPPTDEQIRKTSYLLSSSVLMFQLPIELPALPAYPLEGDALVDFAMRSVSSIAAAINATISPAIALLEATS